MDIDIIERIKLNLDYLSEYVLDSLTNVISLQQILLNSLIDEKKGDNNV